MRFSRELTVGLTLLATLVVIFLGIRFFQGSPLFGSSYPLYTNLTDAGGITEGSAIRLRGVNVGTVGDVTLDTQTGVVRLALKMHDHVAVPTGTHASISGFSAFGSVTLTLVPPEGGGAPLPPGAEIPAAPTVDLLGSVTGSVPGLAARADTALLTANLAAGEVYALLNDPDSDLRLALAGLRQTTNALNALIRAEAATLQATLANTEAITSDLRAFTDTNRDSLTLAVGRLNGVLVRLDRNLATVESSTAALDSMLAGVQAGEGTLGLLLNDTTLYVRFDSTITNVNGLVEDFKRHPGRYLKHLTLVDLF